MRKRHYKKWSMSIFMAILVCSSVFGIGSILPKAENPIIPNVLITEIVANPSGEFDNSQLFEFVELYNASYTSIDLKKYKILQIDNSTYETLRTNYITDAESKNINNNGEILLEPGKAAVVWYYSPPSITAYGEYGTWSNKEAVIAKFREHYGMPDDTLVCFSEATGKANINDPSTKSTALYNSGIQTLAVATISSESGEFISRATYNTPSNNTDSTKSNTDTTLNTAVIFQYPTDNTKAMVKLATNLSPTPGTISPQQKPIDYDDPAAPVIVNQLPTSSMLPGAVTIKATITDDRDMRYAKLYYETYNTLDVECVDMTAATGSNEYTYTIPAEKVIGSSYIKYYFEASDGLHTVTSPTDFNTPYKVSIIDNNGPVVDVLNPIDNNFFFDYRRPVIHAGYSDPSGIDTKSVKLSLNGQDITATAVITENSIMYTPQADLADGKYIICLEVNDNSSAKNKTTTIWTFRVITADTSTGPAIPEILITEIMSNPTGDLQANGKINGADVYEFFELYNASNHDINLKDYKVMYFPYLSAPTDIRTWDLTDDAVIYPGQAAAIWVYSSDSKASLGTGNSYELDENTKKYAISKFRAHYSMPNSIPVYLIHGDSSVLAPGTTGKTFNLHNADQKTIMIAKDTAAEGEYICTATYNDDPDSNDCASNLSVIYTYPTDNSNKLVKIRAAVNATPGTVIYSQIPVNYTDKVEPVILHQQSISEMKPAPVKITATISDETQLRSGKLYYKTFNTSGTVEINMVESKPGTGLYEAEIPVADIMGSTYINYYIEASDGLHTITLPSQTNNPFTISVTDLQGPTIKNLKPSDKFYVEENYKPIISAEYLDASGIDAQSVQLYLDELDVTDLAVKSVSSISYTPDNNMTGSDHKIRLEVSDSSLAKNKTVKEWTFKIGPQVYNFYKGQIHAHTSYSDGSGVPNEAYSYARDIAKKDFFGLTDHGNYINDTSWKELVYIADKYNNVDNYATIPGFEMTWSNSSGWWGHMNSFNTGWVEKIVNNTTKCLPNYYEQIIQTPGSISQFNHPGYLWGDFGEYGYYSEEADAVIDLMEVKSLDQETEYAKALDKGWHISPTNNEDNHAGAWAGTPNATVVLAPRLTRENILEAFHKNRTYSAQDEDVQILYKINDQIMGSRLNNPDKLSVCIEVHHPMNKIGTVTVFADEHSIVATKTFATNDVKWEFELPAVYNYYYVRIQQPNGCLATTAPIWIEKQKAVVLSKLEVGLNEGNADNPVQVRSGITNCGTEQITDVKIEYFKTSTLDSNKLGETAMDNIPAGETITTTFNTASLTSDSRTIYVKVTGKAAGINVAAVKAIKVPELLITEIMPNSSMDTNVTGDPYEFIEVYNNSNNPIDIAKYQIQWFSAAGAAVSTWDITTSKVIQPRSTMVIWIKPSTSNTYADFNARYGTNLEESQIVEFIGKTLDDIGGKTLFISKDGSTPVKISQARYNVGMDLNKDSQEDTSIQYSYPTDGTDIVKKIASGMTPTPGSVTKEQVPYINVMDDTTLNSLEVH